MINSWRSLQTQLRMSLPPTAGSWSVYQSCSHQSKKVTYNQKLATNAWVWMQDLHVLVSKFDHKPLESIKKTPNTCCSTTQITHRLILLLQGQDALLSRCLIWLWKDEFIENRIRDLFQECHDLKWLCFKRANKTVCDLKWAYIAGKSLPSATHTTSASAEQANIYQQLKLIGLVNCFKK